MSLNSLVNCLISVPILYFKDYLKALEGYIRYVSEAKMRSVRSEAADVVRPSGIISKRDLEFPMLIHN